jgi:fucose permease
MLSRLVVTAMGSRITFERQLTLGIGLALAGCVIYILTVGNTAGTVASTVIMGFAFGPIYPAAFAIVARTFKHAAGRAAGLMGVAGSVGAMSIVPLQGVLLERAGGSIMTVYIAVLCALMMACYLYAVRDARKHEQVAVSVP